MTELIVSFCNFCRTGLNIRRCNKQNVQYPDSATYAGKSGET
jgi:hypothetical protein